MCCQLTLKFPATIVVERITNQKSALVSLVRLMVAGPNGAVSARAAELVEPAIRSKGDVVIIQNHDTATGNVMDVRKNITTVRRCLVKL